jgi:hypothetical protein
VTDEVKFTDAQWDALAQAAEAFAVALESERIHLEDVLGINWAGNCVEGLGVLENLRLLLQGPGLNSFGGAINSEVAYLRSLAQRCRDSSNTLTTEDAVASGQFRNAP